MEEKHLIGQFKDGEIQITISEFNGKKYLDIRKYYKNDEGAYKPTKKGIALNKIQFKEILSVLNEKSEEIENSL